MKKHLFLLIQSLLPLFVFSQSLVSVSPSNVNAGQTIDITITGSNTTFAEGSAATLSFDYFKGSKAIVVNSVTVVSNTSIKANITIPDNMYTGDYSVYVSYGNMNSVQLLDGLHISGQAKPIIKSISPDTITAGQTIDVTITGSNTHFSQGSNMSLSVDFIYPPIGGTHVVNSMNIVNDSVITANITVSKWINHGYSIVEINNNTDGEIFKYDGLYIKDSISPSITSVSPSTVKAGQTVDMIIKGSKTTFLKGSYDISFYYVNKPGQLNCNKNLLTVVNDTIIKANISFPESIYDGDYKLQIYDCGSGYWSSSISFHVEGETAPSIKSVNPNTGTIGQTLDVSIIGSNTHFSQGSNTNIDFNFKYDMPGSDFNFNSMSIINDTVINATITIPMSKYTGNYNLSIDNNMDGYISKDNAFYVKGLSPPSLKSISPSTGNAGQILRLKIEGSNTHFSQGSYSYMCINFGQNVGAVYADSLIAINDSVMTAIIKIPSNTYSGRFNVHLDDEYDGCLFLNRALIVNGKTIPSLTSITPSVANAGKTMNVTITGVNTNFTQGSPHVFLNSNNSKSVYIENSITVLDDNSIVANVTIPQNAYTDDYTIEVFNNNGNRYNIILEKAFHINGLTKPSIKSVSPSSANAGQTLDVMISAINIRYAIPPSCVYFDFEGAEQPIINSTNSLNDSSVIVNITIPENAYTKDYSLKVHTYDAGNISLKNCFHVNGKKAPSLKTVSPSASELGKTLNVTISGSETHFTQDSGSDVYFCFNDDMNSLWINSKTVVNDSVITLNVTVPDNAHKGYYDIKVWDVASGFMSLIGKLEIGTNSIAEIAGKSKIKAYPNPANDKISLIIVDAEITATSLLSVFDLRGQLRFQQTITGKEFELDISSYPKGIYFVRVNTKDGYEFVKFVKE